MAKKRGISQQQLDAAIGVFKLLPVKVRIGLIVLLVVIGLVVWASDAFKSHTEPQEQPPPDTKAPADPTPAEADTTPLVNVPPTKAAFPPGTRPVVFCFWNVENLFDDHADHRRPPDKEYDDWFAHNAADREKKYAHLTQILLKMNGGKGPDILACCEVESPRAAEMLKDALNAALPAGAEPYQFVAMTDLDAGRHMAPCVISRLPIDPGSTHLLGSKLRILELRITGNGYGLLLVVSHWTSHLSDDGSDPHKGRTNYAKTIHNFYAAELKKNPKLDFLVCGDFNDSPDSDPVRNKLLLTGDARQVTAEANPPRLYGLLSGKPPREFGTHYYNEQLIYDHIGISPGMFDAVGWGCDADSVSVWTEGNSQIGAKGRRPWRFGNEKDTRYARGYSDHFPVVVTLEVAP